MLLTGIGLFATIFSISLIPVVLSSDFKSLSSRLFSTYLFLTALTTGFLSLSFYTTSIETAKIAYVASIAPFCFSFISFYAFTKSFIKRKPFTLESAVVISLTLLTIIFVTVFYFHFLTTNQILSSIGYVTASTYTGLYIFRMGQAAYLVGLLPISFIAMSIYSLWYQIKNSQSSIESEKYRYLLAGQIIVLISILNNFLPFKQISDIPLLVPSLLISTILISYGITQYKLFEVKNLIAKAIVYLILTLFISSLYLAVGLLLQGRFVTEGLSLATVIGGASITVLVFQPLVTTLQKFTTVFLLRSSYDTVDFLKRFSETISSILDVEKLEKEVDLILSKTFDSTKSRFVTDKNVKLESQDLLEIGKAQGANLEYMQKHNFAILIPLKIRDQSKGILAIGPKKNKKPYSLTDIHTLEAAASQLAIAFDNASLYSEIEETDRLKDEFITIASHHLRTPITAISGYLDYLLGKRGKITSEEQKSFLDHIKTNNERLASLVNELMTISSLEKGTVRIIPYLTSLEDIISESVNEFASFAGERRVEIKFSKLPNLPDLNIDPLKLKEAIQNIIGNAIKFNKPGGTVTIEISQNQNEIEARIIDTGIGIEQSEIGNLFQKFTKVKGGRSEGVGLGLYVTKLIIEAHGGKIWLKSQLGKGTTAYFTLPIPENKEVGKIENE